MNIALILAGGTGSRVGAERPKQFVEVLGRTVLAYTIEIFQNHQDIHAIELVCHEKWIDYTRRMVDDEKFTKVHWIVRGGKDFQHSVLNGINNLRHISEFSGNDLMLIHYGAAPFTSEKIVTDCIEVAKQYGSAFSATPCYQLLGSNDEKKTSTRWVDRDQYIQIACPQCFRFDYLLSIYDRAEEKGLLEIIEPHTTSLVYALGDVLYQSYGDQTNIKITTSEDLDLFEGYVLMKRKCKTAGSDLKGRR